MPSVTIGKCLLPILLKRKRMSSTDLSDKTGIKIQQLSRYINNESTMSLPTALLISWALNVDVCELYDWKVE
jgi:transcriptional regulator with XRE-family HTH domain